MENLDIINKNKVQLPNGIFDAGTIEEFGESEPVRPDRHSNEWVEIVMPKIMDFLNLATSKEDLLERLVGLKDGLFTYAGSNNYDVATGMMEKILINAFVSVKFPETK